MNIDFISNLPKKFYLGTDRREKFFLLRPEWECDWYWSLCQIVSNKTWTHLNHISHINPKCGDQCLFDQLKNTFGNSLSITDDHDLWTFTEIVQTLYTLRKSAEVFYRGGSHISENPDAKLLKCAIAVNKINNVLIPTQIKSLYEILSKYPNQYV